MSDNFKQRAEELRESAKELNRMADDLEKLPNPIGSAITSLSEALLRHGLCVIDRDALVHAEVCMQAFEIDYLSEKDAHGRAYKSVQAAIWARIK